MGGCKIWSGAEEEKKNGKKEGQDIILCLFFLVEGGLCNHGLVFFFSIENNLMDLAQL